MKISIAMATYNGAPYLKDQLDSFSAQTHQPDELVVTDDCSTDETESIVREFAARAPFKVVFSRNERNLGYGGNFSEALSKTTGDLVFLSDQDDVWFPEKMKQIIEEAEMHPRSLVVMNDAALTDAELNEVGLTKIGQFRSAHFPMEHFVMGCCCAVRRDLLDFSLPIPEEFAAHDAWLVWFADGLKRKHVVETVLQWYRRHGANESLALANATQKMTPLKLFIHELRQLRDPAVQLGNRRFQQKKMFLSGVERAIQVAKEPYRTELQELYEHEKRELSIRTRRMEIRQRHFLIRLTTVLKLAVGGAYRKPAGARAAIRDLLGNGA